MDEHFLSNLSLPVPKQFADGGSRRGSGIPENKKISSIEELEETPSSHTEKNGDFNVALARLANIEENVDNHCRDDKDDTLNQKSITTTTSDSQSTTAPYDFSFESDTKTVKFELDASSAFERLGFKPFKKTIEHHHHQLQQQKSDPSEYVHFQPIEVYERNLYRNQQQQQQLQQQQQNQQLQTGNGRLTPAGSDQKASNMLQVPSICLPTLEKPPENMYFGDNITIIDTDLPVRCTYVCFDSVSNCSRFVFRNDHHRMRLLKRPAI